MPLGIDTEAYYRRYGPMVLRRCRSLLGDEEAALDAMQDTFVKLLTYESRLKDQAPSSLLYRMATNVCLNRIRSKKRRPEDPDGELIARIASGGDAEGVPMARRMLDAIFQREVPSTRTIAVLHLLDGMTLQEVADEVGLSVSGVRKRLRTLRARLPEVEALA